MTHNTNDTASTDDFDFRIEFADSDSTPLLHVSTVDSEYLSLRDLVGEPVSITLADSLQATSKLPRL